MAAEVEINYETRMENPGPWGRIVILRDTETGRTTSVKVTNPDNLKPFLRGLEFGLKFKGEKKVKIPKIQGGERK